MPSLQTWRRLVIGGGFLSLSGAWYFRKRIEDNFHAQGYYSKSIEVILNYPPIIEKLGRPLKASKVDLGDTSKNWTNGLNAQLAIPLTGPNGKATVLSWASRPKLGDIWGVDRMDIVLANNHRWTFYLKPQQDNDIKATIPDDDNESYFAYLK